MTKLEAIRRLNEAVGGGPEEGHMEADKILCEFLESRGFQDVVEAWRKVGKWYS